jgi:hypothetical protein
MNSTKSWVLIIGVLVILTGLVVGILIVANNAARGVVDPFQQANRSISTEIASVLHPTPTVLPDPITIIHEVRSLSRLETIQYSVEKVITAETRQDIFGALFGDKLIFVAHGVVLAGVDLEKIEPQDIRMEGSVVSITLPEAEIFVTTLDNNKSYVYDRQTGIFSHGDVNLETTARRAAEEEIQKAALNDGILNLAQQNAEYYLARLVRSLGYTDVIFSVAQDTAPLPTALPPTAKP